MEADDHQPAGARRLGGVVGPVRRATRVPGGMALRAQGGGGDRGRPGPDTFFDFLDFQGNPRFPKKSGFQQKSRFPKNQRFPTESWISSEAINILDILDSQGSQDFLTNTESPKKPWISQEMLYFLRSRTPNRSRFP